MVCQRSKKSDRIFISKKNFSNWKIRWKRSKLKITFVWNRQYRHKNISEISPDKKFVIFRGIQKFQFDEEASAPLTENDDLVVLNVQLNVSFTCGILFLKWETLIFRLQMRDQYLKIPLIREQNETK